jgi:hypothetical protein
MQGRYRHPDNAQRKGDIGMVFESRETEGKETGEGSLSILIVLVEGWRISSMKAT